MSARISLFRPESINAARMSWLGEPRVVAAASTTLVMLVAAGFIAAFAALLIFGEYTRRVRLAGVVLPSDGLARISAPQAGWVSDLRAREGDDVRQGDVLYVLGVDSATALGATQGAVTELLRRTQVELLNAQDRQTDLDHADKTALRDRLDRAEHERDQADAQIRVSEEAIATTQDAAARLKSLVARGLATAREHEARLDQLTAYRLQLETLRRERIQLDARLAEARNQLAVFDLQAETRRADRRRELIGVERQMSEAEARREIRVLAPRAGRVTGVTALPGQTVATGQPLLTIVPSDRPLVVQLLAPSTAIGFIREGARVLLRYEAFPHQKFGQHAGVVTLMSRATLPPDEIARINAVGLDPSRAAGLYRVTVTPERPYVPAYGRREPLQSGMQADAFVLAESRPLYQWIFAPLYSLAGGAAATAP